MLFASTSQSQTHIKATRYVLLPFIWRKITKLQITQRVRVNQRIRFLPNVCGFLLPARLQWLEPAGGKQKSADIEQKTYTFIYSDPNSRTTEAGTKISRYSVSYEFLKYIDVGFTKFESD
jgi:hypothetical protein